MNIHEPLSCPATGHIHKISGTPHSLGAGQGHMDLSGFFFFYPTDPEGGLNTSAGPEMTHSIILSSMKHFN